MGTFIGKLQQPTNRLRISGNVEENNGQIFTLPPRTDHLPAQCRDYVFRGKNIHSFSGKICGAVIGRNSFSPRMG
jgi:hypothetical protein